MKNRLAIAVSLLFLIALVAVNVQFSSAQAACLTISCGADVFETGGIDPSQVCGSGSCWWNECRKRAGQCITSYSQHCSAVGPLGCPNAPCTLLGQSCSSTSECCHPYVCGQGHNGNECTTGTPLMINLNNNSSNFHLTSYTDGVSFDLNATGVPIQVGWTRPGSSIALLALDVNGNGSIDDGSELFGSATTKRDGTRAVHGFDALIDLDGGPGVSNGRIDSRDADYGRLRLWLDDNHDGTSQANELVRLADAGVSTLFTAFEETPRMDRHGNLYKYEGSVRVVKNGRERRHKMIDVLLISPATGS